MIDTPRTDAEIAIGSDGIRPAFVVADFARTLERELVEAREVMSNLSQERDALRIELSGAQAIAAHLEENRQMKIDAYAERDALRAQLDRAQRNLAEESLNRVETLADCDALRVQLAEAKSRARCFIPTKQLEEFEHIPAGQVVPGGLQTLWENLAEHHAQKRAQAESQLATMKSEVDETMRVVSENTANLSSQLEARDREVAALRDMLEMCVAALEFARDEIEYAGNKIICDALTAARAELNKP